MPVKLTVGAQSSNKPAAPSPIPPPDEFPQTISFPDGREVWVSVPFPDRITLVGAVEAEHFSPPAQSGEDLFKLLQAWSQFLVLPGGKTTGVSQKWNSTKKYHQDIVLTVESSGAKVHVSIKRPTNQTPRWRLRLDFNPQRLGPGGFKALSSALSYDNTFLLDGFLAGAKCTRLDVAVDFIGAGVWETILHSRKPGKRVTYTGLHDEIETVQLHHPAPASAKLFDEIGQAASVKTPLSPLGLLHARIYDRVKKMAYLLQPPPFGAAPVTRLELIKTWKGNGPTLKAIFGMKNPFHGYRLSYVGDGSYEATDWPLYVTARRSRPQQAVAAEMQLSVRKSLEFRKGLLAPSSSLLVHEKLWPTWPSGLKLCGLDAWL